MISSDDTCNDGCFAIRNDLTQRHIGRSHQTLCSAHNVRWNVRLCWTSHSICHQQHQRLHIHTCTWLNKHSTHSVLVVCYDILLSWLLYTVSNTHCFVINTWLIECITDLIITQLPTLNTTRKAVLPQGNRAMLQVFFSVEVRQQHSLQV